MVFIQYIWVLGISLATFILVQISPVSARPYQGEEEIFIQPDGSSLPLILYGDEFYIRAETKDGYTVVRDEKNGWICYAMISDRNDSLISSGIPVRQEKVAQSDFVLLKKRLRLTDNELKRRINNSQTRLFRGHKPAYSNRLNALAKSTQMM